MGIKILKASLFLIWLFLFLVKSHQVVLLAETSVLIFNPTDNMNYQLALSNFYKKLVIKKVLEKNNSPLINLLDQFINICNDYNFDCYLLPAIAGLESSFGRFVYPNSYNPFGWGGGYVMFNNWNEAIEIVGKNIKINYINKGLDSIDKIGIVYSENPMWSARIKWFIEQFKNEEERIRLFFSENRIEL